MLNIINSVKMIHLSPVSVFSKNDNPHKFDQNKESTT